MATTLDQPAASPPVASRFVFDDVSWGDYEAMLRIVGDRPIRVTYDRGRLEIMSPSFGHESLAYLLGRLVDVLSEELEVPIEGGGTTTFRRQDLGRGAEPDQCYWLGERAARVRGKPELDFEVDPPPDLVIEVDLASRSLPRLGIFDALGIPEVWRFAGGALQFLHRQAGGGYQARDESRGFPILRLDEAARFLEQARALDKSAWVRAFRTFVRDELAPREHRRE